MTTARSRCSSASTCPPKTAPAPCTPRRATARKTSSVGQRYGLVEQYSAAQLNPVDGRGVYLPSTPPIGNHALAGRTSGRRTTHRRRCCARTARCSRTTRSRTAIRIAGGTRRRWRSAPRRSGSSRWSRPDLRRDALAAIEHVALDSRLGRGAHRRHGRRPPGLVHLAASAPGACRSRCSSHRESGEPHPRTSDADARRSPTASSTRASTPGTRSIRPNCSATSAAGYDKVTDILDVWFDSGVTHECVLAAASAGRPAQAGGPLPGRFRPASRLVPVLAADRRGDGRRGAVSAVPHARLHRRRAGPEDVEVARQRHRAAEHHRQARRRRPAPVDRFDRLPQRDVAVRRNPQAHAPTPTAASATPRASCSATCTASIRRATCVAHADMVALDRWIVHRAHELQQKIAEAYARYDFAEVVQSLVQNFCSVDLGALYLDVTKDRLYTMQEDSAAGGVRRRARCTASPRRSCAGSRRS